MTQTLPRTLTLTLVIVILLQLANRYFRLANEAVINDGLFWGLYHSNFTGSLVIVIGIMATWIMYRIYHLKYWIPVFVISGMLSNLIDRYQFGGVVDYIRLFNFPIFNLPDVLIVLGIIYGFWQLYNHTSQNTKNPL